MIQHGNPIGCDNPCFNLYTSCHNFGCHRESLLANTICHLFVWVRFEPECQSTRACFQYPSLTIYMLTHCVENTLCLLAKAKLLLLRTVSIFMCNGTNLALTLLTLGHPELLTLFMELLIAVTEYMRTLLQCLLVDPWSSVWCRISQGAPWSYNTHISCILSL